MASFVVVFTLAIFLIVSCAAKQYHVFCQYDMNSAYYKNMSQFHPLHIDTKLCTHVVLGSGIGVDKETGAIKIKNDFLEKDMLITADMLKYDSVRNVMISVGGFKEDSRTFSKMVASENKREVFIKSLLAFMGEKGYEGAQIDWRYPTKRGGRPEDMRNFVIFLEELNMIFQEKDYILMVVALGGTDKQTLKIYNIPGIVENVDFINLMVDDERQKHRKRLSYIAPLYGGTNSVAAAVKHWKTVGKAPHKLILNVPLFGRSYTMDRNKSALGSPCKGPGLPARNSNISGFTTYNEYCTQASKWSQHFDKVAKVPYATRGDQWLTYENSESIWTKMHFLKNNELGGAMAWNIDADDFFGECGIRFALLMNIYSALGDPKMLTTLPPTTAGEGFCPQDGFFPDRWECRYYYECRDGEHFDYECVEGQYFDEAKGYCRPAKEVKCDQNFVTWKPGMPGYDSKNFPLNLKIVE